ncbi:MAG: hypothetical protein AB4368_22210 [Xenococcaceae cyanobacterium]
MNQASQYLLELAKRNIQAYIANSEAKAAMVTGSTATGQADFYSDVEMFIYYDELPSIEKLRSARQQKPIYSVTVGDKNPDRDSVTQRNISLGWVKA